MPQVVMGEPFALCQLASAVEAPLAFRNFANAVCGLWVLLLLKPFKQLFQSGIQRYFPGHILIVSASHFDGMNFQRVFLPVNIRPYCLFCFAGSRAPAVQFGQARRLFSRHCRDQRQEHGITSPAPAGMGNGAGIRSEEKNLCGKRLQPSIFVPPRSSPIRYFDIIPKTMIK